MPALRFRLIQLPIFLAVLLLAACGGGGGGGGGGGDGDDDGEGEPDPYLSVQILAASMSENGGTSGVTLKRLDRNVTPDLSAPLTVLLTMDPTGEAQLSQTSVTFAAGSDTAEVTISAIDNAISDGDRTVQVICSTETSSDYDAGSDTITIVDDELPGLSVTAISSVGEADGQLSVTVARTGSRTNSLPFTLTSSDESELAVVSSRLAIPAGLLQTEVLVNIVDDDEDDGDQVVTLSASTGSGDYEDGSTTVTVVDDDPRFELVLDQTSVDEAAGTVTGTIVLTGGLTEGGSVVVDLQSDQDAGNAVVDFPAQVVVPQGASRQEFSITVLDDDDVDVLRSVTVTLTASASGVEPASAQLTIADDDPRLKVELAPAAISENGGETQVTISRTGPADQALDVSVQISPGGKFTPGSRIGPIILSAGQSTSESFSMVAQDNAEANGSVFVEFLALARGGSLNSGRAVLEIQDDEISFSFEVEPSTIAEGQTATGRLTRGGPPATINAKGIVYLDSSVRGVLDLPPQVIFEGGQTTFEFDIPSIQNNQAGPDQLLTLTAIAPGFLDGEGNPVEDEATLTVTDDETSFAIQTQYPLYHEGANRMTVFIRRSDASTSAVINLSTAGDHADWLVPAEPTVRLGVGVTSLETTFAIDGTYDPTVGITIGTVDIVANETTSGATAATEVDIADSSAVFFQIRGTVLDDGDESAGVRMPLHYKDRVLRSEGRTDDDGFYLYDRLYGDVENYEIKLQR